MPAPSVRLRAAELAKTIDPELAARATHYIDNALRPITRKYRRLVFQLFTTWCAERNLRALPAHSDTVVAYAADLSKRLRARSVGQYVSVINRVHIEAGLAGFRHIPEIWAIAKGLARVQGVGAVRSRAITLPELRTLMRRMPHDRRGVRDRALLLLLFAGSMPLNFALRLRTDDLTFCELGILIETHQARRPKIVIGNGKHRMTCPVRALKEHLARQDSKGYVFRHISQLGKLLKLRIHEDDAHPLIRLRLAELGMAQDLSSESFRMGGEAAAASVAVDPTRLAIHLGFRYVRSAERRLMPRIRPDRGRPARTARRSGRDVP